MTAQDTEHALRRRMRELDDQPDHALERVLIDITEQIAAVMEDKGITRKELARRMGVKPPMVTRLLNGNHNTTLRTLMRVAYALDTVIEIPLGRPNACEETEAVRVSAHAAAETPKRRLTGVGAR